MMFSVRLFLQQYLHNIYYGKFFILTICAIVLKFMNWPYQFTTERVNRRKAENVPNNIPTFTRCFGT